RAERCTHDVVLVVGQDRDLLPCLRVPDARRPLAARAHEPPAVGTELDVQYLARLVRERAEQLSGLCVPDTHDVVGAAGRERVPARSKPNAVDAAALICAPGKAPRGEVE